MPESVIHLTPLGDEALTPCCNRVPFELPRTDRLTLDAGLISCPAVRYDAEFGEPLDDPTRERIGDT